MHSFTCEISWNFYKSLIHRKSRNKPEELNDKIRKKISKSNDIGQSYRKQKRKILRLLMFLKNWVKDTKELK